MKTELGPGAIHRNVQSGSEGHFLKEGQISYRPNFGGEMAPLSIKMSHLFE